MAVVGRQASIIGRSNTFAEVSAFADDCNKLEKVPIVDAAFVYDCPKAMRSYLLVVRNALYVPSMKHNLIPPFVMREAGLEVNDVPKIHCGGDVTRESHSIIARGEVELRIPLRLRGIFSCFPSRALTRDEENDAEQLEVVYLTPDAMSWEPNDESWGEREDAYLDHLGDVLDHPTSPEHELIEKRDLEKKWFDVAVSEATWEAAIDGACQDDALELFSDERRDEVNAYDNSGDHIRAQIADLSGACDPDLFARAVEEKLQSSKFAHAAGCTMGLSPEQREDGGLFLNLDVAAMHAGAKQGVGKKHLMKVWRINEEEARRTLEITSQLNRQDGASTLSRNLSTNDRQLRYRRLNSVFFMDTFMVTKGAKSARGFTHMQLFVSDKGFVKVYGMKTVKDIPAAMRAFAKEVGAPNCFVCDPHPNQKSDEVKSFCNRIGSTLRLLEESTQHANRAELYIGLLKEAIRKDLRESNAPLRFWCYCAERRASIFTLTAKRNLFQLQGTNPYTATFGEMADISNLCQFGWYEWVYFRQGKAGFPLPHEELGRCLGPCKNEGNEMAQWVLQRNGEIVPRRTLRRLTAHELSLANETEARKRAAFDDAIRARWGDSLHAVSDERRQSLADDSSEEGWEGSADFDPYSFTPYEDEVEKPAQSMEADLVDSSGKLIGQQSMHDALVNAELLLPQGESMAMAKVVRRAVDDDGRLVGTYNENPVLNTLVYEVEFPDGQIQQYAANLIAENILQQVDSSGQHSQRLQGILDVKRERNAVSKKDGFVVTRQGRRKLRQTTIGWKFQVKWDNGTTQWIPLKLLKESNPVEVADFVKARGLIDEPAFRWWVPFTLKKRDRIVAAISSRVAKKTHKYGIEIPKSVEQAREIDRRNGNTFWQDAIDKEMYNVGAAFKILEDDEALPVGYTKSSGHMIFDVKMDFTRKARWVKDGHKHAAPDNASYAGVVSRESIRIALTYAALMDLEVKAADIRNAYLQAPTSEKHYVICGPEFGLENEGKRAIITRALYGGKVAGRDYWHHLRDCMSEALGFQSVLADPDVWRREATRSDGSKYYQYVLLYTDDVLVISERAEDVLRKELGQFWELKEESIGDPKIYLGGQLRQTTLENGAKCWAFGSAQYVKAAVKNVEEHLAKRGQVLPCKAKTALSNGYRPELDTSVELEPNDAAHYQSLIGILRWMVEIGRADICLEVSMMSSHLALPRKGHLEEVYHIFGYLKKHHNAEMPFDPTEPEIDMSQFERQDWSMSIYGDVDEELPPNMPKPLGKSMKMRVYVDSDHAGESLTRRSRTGFIVFLNNAPIYWMSKKQTTCETSTFGSEFNAMKAAVEYVRGLRYKLRMMGIPVCEPAFVYGDNQSVLANTTAPTSQLKKKSNSIAYHFVREGCARDEWRTTYINTHDNCADLLTKPLPSGEKRSKFIRMLLWWLC